MSDLRGSFRFVQTLDLLLNPTIIGGPGTAVEIDESIHVCVCLTSGETNVGQIAGLRHLTVNPSLKFSSILQRELILNELSAPGSQRIKETKDRISGGASPLFVTGLI